MMDDDDIRWHAEVGAQQAQEEAMHDGKELAAAMAKAFPNIEGAIKGKVNPAFRSKYADLAAVTDAIKPHLEPHGLYYRQVLGRVEDGVTCNTIVCHASGQAVDNGPTFVPVTKKDAHGYAAAYTYARRISLQAAFGVPAEDNDGNEAAGVGRNAQQARQNGPQRPADEPSDAEYMAALDSLRDAALEGMDTLMERFKAIPAGPAKQAVWAQHGAALKAAAAKEAA